MRVALAAVRPLAVLAAAAALVAPAATAAGAASSSDWPTYEQNVRHSSAMAGDPTITRANAPTLKPRWTFTPPGPTKARQPPHTFRASPTVSQGRVFIGSNTGVLYALDAATGTVLWKKLLDYGTGLNCGAEGIGSTATVATDPVSGKPTVYVAGAYYLYALNPATGAQLWKVPVGGTGSSAPNYYYNWSSPAVSGGRIFMGVDSACEPFHVRGGAQSFDQHTGRLLHTYYDMPAGSTGGSVWSSPATDGSSVWVTTGDPAVTSAQVGDSYSIVRLDAATLTKKDRWRTTDTASEDYDFGSSPTLWTSTIGGKSVPLVGACNKNGTFYAWRSGNLAAGPVWRQQVGDMSSSPFSFCITSAAYDSGRGRLFIASNTTTVNGQKVPGAIRAVDPATGTYLWQKPLDCGPLGSPTLNTANGIVAVPTYICATGKTASVQLYDEVTGTLIARIDSKGPVFAQPVWAAGALLVAGGGKLSTGGASLTAYAPSVGSSAPVSPPRDVGARVAGPSSATLSWKPPIAGTGAITGYRVTRNGTDSYGGGPWSATVPATNLSQTYKYLVPGRTYTLSVSALTAQGASRAVAATVTLPPAAGR